MPASRLLVLDDDPIAAAAVRDAAGRCGLATELATSPTAFLDRLATWTPSLVMLDLQALAANGTELLSHLGSHPGNARIILCGGSEGRAVEVGRLLSGRFGFDVAGALSKPLHPSALDGLLEHLADDRGWCTTQALAAAIANQELFLVYQPKIGLRDGRVVGYEGLLRWRHAQHGIVAPDVFIPVAERSGLIGRITETVIECGLGEAAAWGGPRTNSLAINLSGSDLRDANFADRLTARCSNRQIDPSRMVLELTEASAMADSAEAIGVMTRLRRKGFRLSIDDFGTGHSSLLQLARLPFSELKIDKTFVIEANSSPEARVIIKSTADLAHNLGLRAVAEGVENAEVRHLVRELGCDIAQGFGIGQPMPAAQIEIWVGEQAQFESPPEPEAERTPQRHARATRPSSGRAYDGSEAMRNLLGRAIAHRLNPLWGLGRNALVGWRPAEGGIEVLMMPYQTIVQRFAESKRLLHGRRLMGDGTFGQAIELSGVRPVPVSLPFGVADDDPAAVPTNVVEQLLRRYSISETPHRAVALFDVVGIAGQPPSARDALLNSLESSITTAVQLMHDLGKPIELSRATIGDGFYIWNRKQGAEADLDTYLLTLLTVAENAVARRDGSEVAPQLRTCFSVGPHYSYDEAEALDAQGHDHIVGDITVGLARMVGKCLPGQILIGDFSRPTEAPSEPGNPLEFVVNADGMFAKYDNVRLHGHTVAGVRCYFTGEARGAGRFDVTRFRIRDQDGVNRDVFNQKFNVYLTESPTASARVDPLYLGRQLADLAAFEALEVTPIDQNDQPLASGVPRAAR